MLGWGHLRTRGTVLPAGEMLAAKQFERPVLRIGIPGHHAPARIVEPGQRHQVVAEPVLQPGFVGFQPVGATPQHTRLAIRQAWIPDTNIGSGPLDDQQVRQAD